MIQQIYITRAMCRCGYVDNVYIIYGITDHFLSRALSDFSKDISNGLQI